MHHVRSALKCALLVLPLVLSGCLDYGEELTLAADGSGTLKVDFTADMKFMADVAKALGDEPTPEDMRGPTREEILEGLKVEGIEVKELEVSDKDQKSKVHMLIAFKSLEALSRVEGFGDDRKIDFYDDNGKVRVVYSFDTTDIVPVDDTMNDEAGAGKPDPIEQKIQEITMKARDQIKFRAKVKLPGAIVRSNGRPIAEDPNASAWVVDKTADPKRHATLGRGKITMMLLVERAAVPFVKELKPLPREGDEGEGGTPPGPGSNGPGTPPPPTPPGKPGSGGLGD